MGSENEYGFKIEGKEFFDSGYHGFHRDILSELIQLSKDVSFLRSKEEKWVRQEDNQFNNKWVSEYRAAPIEEYISELGRTLFNGGRFYIDSLHPEFSTSEVTKPKDLVLFEKSGEFLVARSVKELEKRRNLKIFVHKNNSDGHGNSYGYHDNYLLSRTGFDSIVEKERKFDDAVSYLAQCWLTFMVTGIIYTGAGKYGSENNRPECFYQISQRADFFSQLSSCETMFHRGLLNTRDEPHANRQLFGRFHVIFNDANMSEFQTYIKTGVQALFLKMLDFAPANLVNFLPILKDPVKVLPVISRDLELREKFPCEDGVDRTALEIQKLCLIAMEEFYSRNVSVNWINECLVDFRQVLNELSVNPLNLCDRIDWIAKKYFIDEYQKKKNSELDFIKAKRLDFHYHQIPNGLYHSLLEPNSFFQMKRLFNDSQIEQAMINPPVDTRAYFRGFLVKNFPDCIADVDWSFIELKLGNGRWRLHNLDLWAFNKNLIDAYFSNISNLTDFTLKLLRLFLVKGRIVSPLGSITVPMSFYSDSLIGGSCPSTPVV
ncbi:MAG: proteasome accessory factor PafA2 family protein [Candidatus Brennerbacteria bacterium]|nr:proteasome accessory factor PafA2 family protein [Candidatus Brennerbacteria bacterium]